MYKNVSEYFEATEKDYQKSIKDSVLSRKSKIYEVSRSGLKLPLYVNLFLCFSVSLFFLLFFNDLRVGGELYYSRVFVFLIGLILYYMIRRWLSFIWYKDYDDVKIENGVLSLPRGVVSLRKKYDIDISRIKQVVMYYQIFTSKFGGEDIKDYTSMKIFYDDLKLKISAKTIDIRSLFSVLESYEISSDERGNGVSDILFKFLIFFGIGFVFYVLTTVWQAWNF